MKLLLERVQQDPDVTIGSLSIDGDWECWVLEDPVREVAGKPVGDWKIPGDTAIPRGVYQLIINRSARFGTDLPLLVNVPSFAGVRIHTGNTTANTEGCLIVGLDRHAKSVGRSRAAMAALFAKLYSAITLRGEHTTITVV